MPVFSEPVFPDTMPDLFQSDLLKRTPGVLHGFLGRRGGVSRGEFSSLNCSLSSGDEEESLRENRRRAAAVLGLGPADLVTLNQMHGRRVWRVSSSAEFATARDGDGLVTRERGVAIGVLTADCAPLLFADGAAGVVGAAHAGWKGALAGVAEAVLDAMSAQGAVRERIVAAIGPCIRAASYEVDAGFAASLARRSPLDAEPFLSPRDGTWSFDLPGYLRARLVAAGVRQVDPLAFDTFVDETRFFSYRRSTRRGEVRYGRQLSVIALAP